jgi:acyl-coenzyme A synthetase/AMP-(fatty) acid ligase
VITGPTEIDLLAELLDRSDKTYELVTTKDSNLTMKVRKKLNDVRIAEASGEMPTETEFNPDDTAYLLFTSGSTGNPKGVAVSNRNATAYLDNIISMFDFTPEDRFTQCFDLTFDLSVHDLFVCWSIGACLCIPDDNSTFGLVRYLKDMKPTVWFSVPSVANLMNHMRLLKEGSFSWLRISFFCGEALLLDTALAWKRAAPGSQVINLYGPTEATIAISAYTVPERAEDIKSNLGIVSIGKIFPGHIWLFKGEENDEGELCLSGPQVVTGYFNEEKLTQEYFFHTGTPSHYYNTGDLVEADKDGDLFFLGRSDSEVKISGYRVNLLEIDHIISLMEEVEHVATLYLPIRSLDNVLISFLVTYKKKVDILSVLDHCRNHLPSYMVPEKIIFVETMPLNPNGKIDKKALASIFYDQNE